MQIHEELVNYSRLSVYGIYNLQFVAVEISYHKLFLIHQMSPREIDDCSLQKCLLALIMWIEIKYNPLLRN